MTDSLDGLTVIFEKEIREDSARHIISAIKQFRGVADVVPVVSTSTGWLAARRTKLAFLEELMEWIVEKNQE